MSIKGFHIVFIVFSTLLALGIGCYCVWVDLTVGEPVYRTGAIAPLSPPWGSSSTASCFIEK